ncbi:MAG: hypothetical protein GSR81_02880 [Desulfurococcales archaeon]|nr:hypothetical protein [Desulfurococcales archaeon]
MQAKARLKHNIVGSTTPPKNVKAPLLAYFRDSMIKPQGYRYTLSQLILDTHREGSNLLAAVVANPYSIHKRGIGKTVYALRILVDVYRTVEWEELRKYIVFMPQDFLKLVEEILNTGKRIPLVVWDDAGFWLNRQRWHNKFVIAVRENLNVIRTAITSIVFTAPTWSELARGIRDHLDIVVLITRKDRERSIARGYKLIQGFLDWNKKELLFEDYFRIMLPNEIYKPYEEMRMGYVKVGLERMKARLKDILENEEEGEVYEPESLEEFKEMFGY